MSESEEADVISNHNQTVEETKSNITSQMSIATGAMQDQSAGPKLYKIQELDCENEMSFQ